jgi:hypothetical protein
MLYFSNGGNDITGDGSQSNPYQTVAKANALLLAWTPGAFDGLSFLGGQTFGDAALSLTSVAGASSTTRFIITSHGTGRAKLNAPGTSRSLTLTTCSYITVRNISLISTVGTGTAGEDCAYLTGCTDVRFDRVDTLGGNIGVDVTTSTVSFKSTVIRHPTTVGLRIDGNTVSLDDVEVYGAGHDQALAATGGAGVAFQAIAGASAAFAGYRVRILKCIEGMRLESGMTHRFRRLLYRTDQATQVAPGFTSLGGDTLELYDSVVRFGGDDGLTPYFGFTISTGTLRLYNTTVHNTAGFCVSAIIVAGTTVRGYNSVFTASGSGLFLMYVQALTTRSFTNCRFYSAWATPFFYEAAAPVTGTTSLAAWLATPALNHTNCSITDPGYEDLTRLGPEWAKLSATSDMIAGGTDLTTTYSALGYALTDYFGVEHFTGLWSIGAAEVVIATLQSFSEGGGQAALNGAVDYDCIASLRELPSFGNFPVVDHQLSATVRFEPGMTRLGIWMLGGRVGSSTVAPSIPVTSRIYQHTFDSGLVVDLEDGGRWDVGLTPGAQDSRRVIFEIKKVGTVYELSINGSTSGAQGTTFSSTTTGAGALFSLVPFREILLTLKVRFAGRVPGLSGRSDYRFNFIGEVDGVVALSATGIVIPQGWIEGAETTNASGVSSWAGIIGKRTGASNPAVQWRSFAGLITGAVSAVTVPAAAAGEVRPKDYTAPRWAGMNRLSNGGFTSFPKTPVVHEFTAAIESLDPTYEAPAAELPVHVVVLVDASGSMREHSGNQVRTRTMLNNFALNLPTDESVILTVIRCWGGNQADQFVTTQVVRSANRPTIAAALNGIVFYDNAGWPAGVTLTTQVLTAGVVDTTLGHVVGARQIVYVVSDESGYDLNAASTAVRDALHALPALSEVSVFSVEEHATTLATNFSPLLFPTAIPANTPRDPALPSDPAIPALITIPDTTGCISLSTKSLKKPSLTPTQGATGTTAASRIGSDMAAEVIKWIDDYTAMFQAAPPPPTVFRNAYEAWPALDASYAFDVRAGKTGEALGPWVVTGASASIEVRPLDADGEVIRSKDGGNVIRVTLGAKGEIDIAQSIVDVRPFRGDKLTVAYSGAKVTGNPRVAVVLKVDGVETEADVSYGGSLGVHTRRVAKPTAIALAAKTIDVIIRIKGNAGDSLLLSGIAAAQGDYAYDLPYSESAADLALPSGCVIMYTGSSCPPGFRPVPGMDGRNAYAFTGDPHFYAREFTATTAGGAARTGPLVEVVLLVDGSATQSTDYSRTVVLAWLNEMVSRGLPKNGTVSLSIVFSNAGYPGYTLVEPVTLTRTTEQSVLDAIGYINDPNEAPAFAPPSGDRMVQGFDVVTQILASSAAPVKMVFYNTDASFPHNGAAYLTSFAALTAVPNLVEVSAAAVSATRASVLAVGGESLIYPAPSATPPGILFEATGGLPGFSLADTYKNQPFQAGAYVAEVFSRSVRQQIAFLQSTDDTVRSGGVASNLGGQEFHDHAGGTQFGSSIDEPDGFEDPTGDSVTTAVPIPTQDMAVIKPYRYHVLPSLARPEDPAVYALGPAHSHRLDTLMSAMPPSFPVLFCEKL